MIVLLSYLGPASGPLGDNVREQLMNFLILQRAFKSHDVTLIHKPVNSLRSQLVRVKDTTVNLKKCGTVYQIHCEKCNKEYVGETARALEIRVKEHQSRREKKKKKILTFIHLNSCQGQPSSMLCDLMAETPD